MTTRLRPFIQFAGITTLPNLSTDTNVKVMGCPVDSPVPIYRYKHRDIIAAVAGRRIGGNGVF